jgi:hypothetical protein
MPLVFMRSVPQFPEPVEEHGAPCQGIFRLAFVEPDMNAPPQFGAADVLKQEQRPFDLSEFSQRHGEPILTGDRRRACGASATPSPSHV